MISDALELVDYRRRVATLYSDIQRSGVGPDSWLVWRRARTELLLTHPQSPIVNRNEFSEESLSYFEYDPSWNVIGTVEPLADDEEPAKVAGGPSTFTQIGSVLFERNGESHSLALFWLDAYGGGLLVPFRDKTNGTSTYGAGRYILDGAKSADLGAAGQNELVLDFNFSYHPSCMWDPQWPCPLAPPTSHLAVEVAAGEKMPEQLMAPVESS